METDEKEKELYLVIGSIRGDLSRIGCFLSNMEDASSRIDRDDNRYSKQPRKGENEKEELETINDQLKDLSRFSMRIRDHAASVAEYLDSIV